MTRWALAIHIAITVNRNTFAILTVGPWRARDGITDVNTYTILADLTISTLRAASASKRDYAPVSDANRARWAVSDGAVVNAAVKVAELIVFALAI